MARPTPTRTFTTELSPAGSPRTDVDHDYTGKQSTPATRLPLARHTTVWAAKKETKGTKVMSRLTIPSVVLLAWLSGVIAWRPIRHQGRRFYVACVNRPALTAGSIDP